MKIPSIKDAIRTLSAAITLSSPARRIGGETICLFSEIANGDRIDAETGLLRKVSILTEGEAKGHGIFIDGTTLKTVMVSAQSNSGGVKVKMNHGQDVTSIVGVMKNFSIEGIQLFGDLQLLKTCDQFDYIIEMAQTMPETFGMSISFALYLEEIGGKDFARCTELFSIDIVDAPAANPGGLFSAKPVQLSKRPLPAQPMTRKRFKSLDIFEKISFAESGGQILLSEMSQYKPAVLSRFLASGGSFFDDITPPSKTNDMATKDNTTELSTPTPLITTAAQFIRMSAADQSAFGMGAGQMLKGEFDKLPTPLAKASFFKLGGKLVDEPYKPIAHASGHVQTPAQKPGHDRLGNKRSFTGDGIAKSYADFSAMAPEDKTEFLRQGGRISE